MGILNQAARSFTETDPGAGVGSKEQLEAAAGRELTGTDMKFLMQAGRAGDLSQFTPGAPDYEAKYATERAAYEDRHSRGQALGALGIAAPFILGAGLGIGSGAAGAGAGGTGAALGGGLSAAPGSGAILGAGAPAGGYAMGGITPGVASGSIGAGSLGTGIGYGVTGGLGAIGAAGGASGAAGGATALGSSGAEALGLPASGAAPAAAVPAAASSAPTATSAAGAAAAPSFTDSLIKQMKDNALSLGLMGAGTAASLSAGKGQMPNEAAMQGMGADAAAVSKQLIAQYQSGNLAPGQKAGLDQLTQNTKNQLRQYFASIGQADSTAAVQAMAQVDASALEMKQQMLDTALQQGLSAIGVAQGPLNSIAQYQLGQDQQLKQAFGNFAGGMGMLMGRNSGTPTPPTSSVQKPPTQP